MCKRNFLRMAMAVCENMLSAQYLIQLVAQPVHSMVVEYCVSNPTETPSTKPHCSLAGGERIGRDGGGSNDRRRARGGGEL